MSSFKPYPKVVFVTSRFPFPLEKGDKLRAFHQIKQLSKTCEIHLISLSDIEINVGHKSELQKYCKSVKVHKLSRISIFWNILVTLFSTKPLQVGYFFNRSIFKRVQKELAEINPDHIIGQLIRTSEYIKNYHKCPKTLDYMDALSKGIERRISKQKCYVKWVFKLETKRLQNYERSVFDYFEHKIIISEQDRNFIFHPDRKKIHCVPNGIDESFLNFERNITPKFDLVFVGNMSYAPNVDAVNFIVEKIISKLPELKLLVAGATPHASLSQLEKKSPQLTIAGWVDDIREAYSDGKIFLAPMMIGTGMQNKLLEAMALGIPCITTDLANNAIHADHNESIIVANDEQEMIAAVKNLIAHDSRRSELGIAGQNYVKNHFSWEESTKILVNLVHLKGKSL